MSFLTRPDLVSSDIYLPHPETGTTSGYYTALDSRAKKAKFTQAFKTASLEYHVEIDWDGVRPLTGAERRTRLERCWAKAGFPKRYWPTVGERERVGPGEAFQGGSEVTKKKETWVEVEGRDPYPAGAPVTPPVTPQRPSRTIKRIKTNLEHDSPLTPPATPCAKVDRPAPPPPTTDPDSDPPPPATESSIPSTADLPPPDSFVTSLEGLLDQLSAWGMDD